MNRERFAPSSQFLQVSEQIWSDWLAERRPDLPDRLSRSFSLDHSPEPYTAFGDISRPLVFLTTNPGRPMRHQRRPAVSKGEGPLNRRQSWGDAARHLGTFYTRKLADEPAGRRIASMCRLAEALNFSGVLQVEACPFRSPSMNTAVKTQWRKAAATGGLAHLYVSALREFLATQPVIAIAAVSSASSIETQVHSEWIVWLRQLVGFADGEYLCKALIRRDAKVTCAALLPKKPATPTRAVSLMMGSNQLPGEAGLRRLIEAFRPGGDGREPSL